MGPALGPEALRAANGATQTAGAEAEAARERNDAIGQERLAASGQQLRDYSRLHGPHVRKAFKDALMAP